MSLLLDEASQNKPRCFGVWLRTLYLSSKSQAIQTDFSVGLNIRFRRSVEQRKGKIFKGRRKELTSKLYFQRIKNVARTSIQLFSFFLSLKTLFHHTTVIRLILHGIAIVHSLWTDRQTDKLTRRSSGRQTGINLCSRVKNWVNRLGYHSAILNSLFSYLISFKYR